MYDLRQRSQFFLSTCRFSLGSFIKKTLLFLLHCSGTSVVSQTQYKSFYSFYSVSLIYLSILAFWVEEYPLRNSYPTETSECNLIWKQSAFYQLKKDHIGIRVDSKSNMTDVLRRRGEEIQTQGRKPGEDRDSDHDNYKPNKYQRLPVTTRT